MTRPLRRWLSWLCAGGWIAAFVATHIPAEELPAFQLTDKTLHTVGYAGLTTLFWLALWGRGRRLGTRVVLCLAVLPAYGAFDELLTFA